MEVIEHIPPALQDTESVPEAQVEHMPLTFDDSDWLATLRGQPINAAWLRDTNRLVALGSRNLVSVTEPAQARDIRDARQQVYGEQLGWASPAHPIHKAYKHFFIREVKLAPPPATALSTQRVLADKRIDLVRTVKGAPEVLGLSPASVLDKFENLQELGIDTARVIGHYPTLLNLAAESVLDKFENLQELGIDVVRLINKKPVILGYKIEAIQQKVDDLSDAEVDVKVIEKFPSIIGLSAELVKRRLRIVQRISKILQWQEESTDLINVYPQIVSYSEEKLLTHARLFARHGQPDLTISQVRTMMTTPLECHLLALGESGEYTQASIQRAYRRPDREARVADLLDNENTRQWIGEKVIRAYDRYANRCKA